MESDNTTRRPRTRREQLRSAARETGERAWGGAVTRLDLNFRKVTLLREEWNGMEQDWETREPSGKAAE